MEPCHVVGRQVDPVPAEVLGDVLEVLDDLQCGADGVGAADPFGARRPGELEDQAADGVGGELAVGEQFLVRPVAADLLVLPVGLDEAEEGFGGQRAAPYGGAQCLQQGVVRGLAGGGEDPAQVGFECVEHREPVLALFGVEAEVAGVAAAGGEITVADVVDEPGVAVDGHQVVAPGSRQKERSHREILVGGLVKGSGYSGIKPRPAGTRHCGPPCAGTA